jgi:alpha-L-fucosidase
VAHDPKSVSEARADGNDLDRLEWFRDLGLGLFIHWSVDTQLGVDISHSLVGADEGYVANYFERLPRSFAARRFAPDEWAALARLAGVKYMMFTTKHHNGFCMFHTKTTDWQIANTPFGRDATGEIVEAFRAEGIAPGVYFSPDDFAWLRENGIPIQRHTPEVVPANNPGLMELDKTQVTELLSNYGDIDFIFFDGPAEGLRDHAWEVRPEVLVTRGAIPTPEQHIPGLPAEGAWESNLTMGTQWTYKPTNEHYKSGGELITRLIETRAKGGNLLLNIGPKPDGTLPIEQEQLLQELALWMFVNGEAIHGTRPWIITNERELWFTTKDDGRTLYVFAATAEPWKWAERKEFLLASVHATEATEVSILGQNGTVLEYRPDVDPSPRWEQQAEGLRVSALNTQRLYNDRKWPNPVVLKLTNVEHAFLPPRVSTSEVTPAPDAADALEIRVTLDSLGDSAAIIVSAEYQDITGLDVTERPDGWVQLDFVELREPGAVSIRLPHARPGNRYAVRARASLPLFSVNGAELTVVAPVAGTTT